MAQNTTVATRPAPQFVTQIASILKDFDFERVHRVMTLLQWNWAGSPNPPSLERLQERARELPCQAAVSPYETPVTVGSGGLRAIRYREPLYGYITSDVTILKLEFILAVGYPAASYETRLT